VFEDAFRNEACRTYSWRRWSVPCLFLVGEHEKIYSPTAAPRRLRRVAPLVQAEIIPGAGHDLSCAQPDLVARRVLEFLNEPVALASGETDRADRRSVAAS
jgi:pimeloyl-ACP methyl ester carboxylesterase